MTHLTITHTYSDGTLIEGSSKGDGVLEIVRKHGFTWRREPGIFIMGSRDKDAQMWKIDPAAGALREAGHTVEMEIDNTPRTAAEREADRAERVDGRVDRLEERAGRAADQSNAAYLGARKISDGIPFGQPVQPPGHHSRGKHLRALDRIESGQRKSYELSDKAGRLADRATGAARNEAHKHDPRAIMRKIETLEEEARGITRKLAGYTRNFRNGSGEIYAQDVTKPATGEYAERLKRRADVIAEEIAHLRGKLDAHAEAGTFVAWAAEHFQKGDYANVSGRWCEVARINKKGVSVRSRWDWHTNDSKPEPVKWDDIHGRRRDGMQWDTPNGEPWPVEMARKVAKWAKAQHSATLPSAQYEAATRHVGYARRLVHGLDLSASDAELKAYEGNVPDDRRRDLAVAYLAVFDRLEAGETVPDIKASLTPFDGVTPTWQMPDTEPEDRRAGPGRLGSDDGRQVQPGDIIVGFYDRGFAGSRSSLVRAFCGPVGHVSEVDNRREAGEWVTVTLTTGASRAFQTHTWFSAHPAAQAEAAEPESVEPEAVSERPADVECYLTGEDGETPDDCTTHSHTGGNGWVPDVAAVAARFERLTEQARARLEAEHAPISEAARAALEDGQEVIEVRELAKGDTIEGFYLHDPAIGEARLHTDVTGEVVDLTPGTCETADWYVVLPDGVLRALRPWQKVVVSHAAKPAEGDTSTETEAAQAEEGTADSLPTWGDIILAHANAKAHAAV